MKNILLHDNLKARVGKVLNRPFELTREERTALELEYGTGGIVCFILRKEQE